MPNARKTTGLFIKKNTQKEEEGAMKKVAKKLLSLVVVVCIAFMGVFTVPTFGAKAATTEETLTVTGKTGALAEDSLSISWTGTNISFVNEKTSDSSAIRNSDSAQYRVYKNSIGTVSVINGEPIVKVVITCDSADYATVCSDSFAATNVETSVNGKIVTVVPTAVVSSVSYNSTAQWRLNAIAVTYGTVTGPVVTVKGANTLLVGERTTLTTELTNCEGTPVWTSSNTNIATVENGVVTAKAVGTTTITADVNGTTGALDIFVSPVADSSLTLAEAIETANWAGGSYTSDKYYVEGTITDLYNTTYGNFHLVDAEGNDLLIYGLYSEGGDTRYDAMEVKPVAGDFVRVYGILGTYNSTPQMKDAWLIVPTDYQAEVNEVNAYTSLAYTYTQNGETFETSDFRIRFGVDAALTEIADVEAYGIQVTVGDTVVKYNASTADSWTVENGYAYVVVDLGDIINDMDKLNTVFTVAAYIVVDGTTYVSTATKPHSVATMVAEYYANEETKAAVEHLYNYLNA